MILYQYQSVINLKRDHLILCVHARASCFAFKHPVPSCKKVCGLHSTTVQQQQRFNLMCADLKRCFVFLTGLPFPTPQRSPRQTSSGAFLLLLWATDLFEFGRKRRVVLIDKMVQNKITEISGFHRSFKVGLFLQLIHIICLRASIQCRGDVLQSCINLMWKVTICPRLHCCKRGSHFAAPYRCVLYSAATDKGLMFY